MRTTNPKVRKGTMDHLVQLLQSMQARLPKGWGEFEMLLTPTITSPFSFRKGSCERATGRHLRTPRKASGDAQDPGQSPKWSWPERNALRAGTARCF